MNTTQYHTYLTRCMKALALCCALSVFLYGIFLLMAVKHTASRTAFEKQIHTLSAHLGDVEMQYLIQQKTLTPERAAELGFVKSTVVLPVYATSNTRVLTLNTLQ